MATASNYLDNYRFQVEIDGFTRTGFQKVSGLKLKLGVTVYKEGNQPYPDKSLNNVAFDPIVLSYGATVDDEVFNWIKQCVDIASGKITADAAQYKKSLAVVALDGQGQSVKRYEVTNAFPTEFDGGEFDADGTTRLIRSVTIDYDYYDIK